MDKIAEDETFCFPTADIHILSRPDGDGYRRRFSVHKHVLKQSPVFDDMFALGSAHEEIESEKDRTASQDEHCDSNTAKEREDSNVKSVEINLDDSEDCLKAMFLKLYEGHTLYNTEIPDHGQTNLLEAAQLVVVLDKYGFQDDAAECRAFLRQV